MDKEDFYDMLVKFVELTKIADNGDTFDWVLEKMDSSEDMKQEFTEMVS